MNNVKSLEAHKGMKDQQEARELLLTLISHYGPRWYIDVFGEWLENVAETTEQCEIKHTAETQAQVFRAIAAATFVSER